MAGKSAINKWADHLHSAQKNLYRYLMIIKNLVSLGIRKMQVKTALRFHFMPVKLSILKKAINAGEGKEKAQIHSSWRLILVLSTVEVNSKQLHMISSATSSACPKGIWISIAVFITPPKLWCQSPDEWIKKTCTHTRHRHREIAYHSATKRIKLGHYQEIGWDWILC